MAPSANETGWDNEYNILKRENLFRNPPVDNTAYPFLQAAVDPHIESFNHLCRDDGEPSLLDHAAADIGTKTYFDGDEKKGPSGKNILNMRIKKISFDRPLLPSMNKVATDRKILPAECRERHTTYRGRLAVTFEYEINGGEPVVFTHDLGNIPIMVKSNRCHLENNSPALLVQRKEESEELGGYFIINGLERIIRLLQLIKRNYPMAINRPNFAMRGPSYTQHCLTIRCVRPDETPQSNVLHFLEDGNVLFRFSWRKNEYLAPVIIIIKALIETNDRFIFESIVGPAGSEAVQDTFMTERVGIMLRTFKLYKIYTKIQARTLLGKKFRAILGFSDTLSDYQAGTEFLRKIVLVHLGNVDVTEQQDIDKSQLLLFMIRKLYALASGDCAEDNPDTVQNQELLLGGFLYGQIIKEKLEEFLDTSVRSALRDFFRRNTEASFLSDDFKKSFPAAIFRKAGNNLGVTFEYFVSTGNLLSPSGLDLQQTVGFTVVAEKLNFLRFISHFRMVHRGAFFAELKTTAVRKLLPESWGFLCPVHTPDGAPCGLLNHLAHKCKVVTSQSDVSKLPELITKLSVVYASPASSKKSAVIMLDGKILGWCKPGDAVHISDSLRHWKVQGGHGIPLDLEIGHVPPSTGGAYPGIYMASTPSRLMRPVKYLPLQKEDMVGPYEQPFMSIAVVPEEVESGVSTHVEFDPTNILSILANMTPFSDFNQSPRNMYQCQMGKQTMGTPATALAHRTDSKMYRLQTGQTPIVRAPLHNAYGFDNFPNGTNAVVAVISYTSYDMDDAMILNKSALERGFGYGSIYKTHKISLNEDVKAKTTKTITKTFGFAPNSFVSASYQGMLDDDGLPPVGRKVQKGDIICAWHTVTLDDQDRLSSLDDITHYEKYKDEETAYVEDVRLIYAESGNEPLQTISIKFRIPRASTIGDKFSSRHGQKGVCSMSWPAVDMPFSESGIQPDLIINPHAFPSRMTIGMFVESMAGKAGALHGLAQDSTPFKFSEEHTAADHFGRQLQMVGYNYHGNEPMYSGITGEELAADIYVGVVYYQRLRHMVNDKLQTRTMGSVVSATGQPVHGRKRGGGVRMGEMERDALMAHGTAFLVQDRLLNCSDYTRSWVCRRCGSLLSVQSVVPLFALSRKRAAQVVRCRGCATKIDKKNAVDLTEIQGEIWRDGQGNMWAGGDETTQIVIPGSLKYLDVELSAMGIKLKYKISRDDEPRLGELKPMSREEIRVSCLKSK